MSTLPENEHPIVILVNCVSYSDEDGCTYDDYDIQIHAPTGRIEIHHEIRCGLMGSQLFCEPAIVKDFGIPFPPYLIQLVHMMFVNNDLKTEPRHKAVATDHFLKWLVDTMESLAQETTRHQSTLQQFRREKEEAERDLEEQHQDHQNWMNTSMELLKLLQK